MYLFISRLFSLLFHPVFYFFYLTIYLYATTRLFYMYRSVNQFILLCIIVFFSTVVFPLAVIWLFQKDFLVNSKEKRTLTYLITGFIYFIFLSFSEKFFIPELLINYLRLSIFCLIILMLLNFKIKVSLHSSGTATVLVFILYLASLNPVAHGSSLIIWILISGLIISSRIYLKQHSLLEAGLGFATGFLPPLIFFLLI